VYGVIKLTIIDAPCPLTLLKEIVPAVSFPRTDGFVTFIYVKFISTRGPEYKCFETVRSSVVVSDGTCTGLSMVRLPFDTLRVALERKILLETVKLLFVVSDGTWIGLSMVRVSLDMLRVALERFPLTTRLETFMGLVVIT